MPKHAAPPPSDLIARTDIPGDYERSTRWAFRRAQAGLLATYYRDGDPRAYHSREEVESLLAPRVRG